MKLRGRLARLERPGRTGTLPRWARAYARHLAEEDGLDPDVLIAEAETLVAEEAAAGVLGSAARTAEWAARETGGDPDALLVEAEKAMAA